MGVLNSPAPPRSVTVGGASYGGAWLERFQPYGDTETVFSFRFGAEARADQALVVHTRYTDHEHRVALRVTRAGVQLINRGAGEPSPLPLVFAAHPAATGVWYDVLARTVGGDILVWIRRQDSPYTLEQATVFTPPLDFRVQGEPNAEVGQLLHTDSARLRVGFNTQPNQPILPGAIALRGLAVRALPCEEDAFPPATHTPCADVVISEIYPHDDVLCLEYDAEEDCVETLQGPWIELWNRGDAPVDLEGWALTDDLGLTTGHVFPAETVLAPGAYLLVEAPISGALGGIVLNAQHGGFLALLCGETAKSTSSIGAASSSVFYGPVAEGESVWLQYPNGGQAGTGHEATPRPVSSPRPGLEDGEACNPGSLHFRFVGRSDKNPKLGSSWIPWPPRPGMHIDLGVMNTSRIEFKLCGADAVSWEVSNQMRPEWKFTTTTSLPVFVNVDDFYPDKGQLFHVPPYLDSIVLRATSVELGTRTATIQVSIMGGPDAYEYAVLFPSHALAMLRIKVLAEAWVDGGWAPHVWGGRTGDNSFFPETKSLLKPYEVFAVYDGRGNMARHGYLAAFLALELGEHHARQILRANEVLVSRPTNVLI